MTSTIYVTYFYFLLGRFTLKSNRSIWHEHSTGVTLTSSEEDVLHIHRVTHSVDLAALYVATAPNFDLLWIGQNPFLAAEI